MGQHRGASGAWAVALIGAALAALGPGCATGSPVDPRGGDGGGGGGGGTDAGADAASAPDAGVPIDAAAEDAGAAPVDAGGADAGTPDAGHADAGRGDAGCSSGATMSCTTSCGTAGTSSCVAGAWTGCAPPLEACNGADDDCDSMPDDGFSCVRGASRACTTSCGSTGSQACGATCNWSACAPPAEVCNGADDDCDSGIDEGSRATVVRVSYADLSARHAPCDGTTEYVGPNCAAAIHRHCAARGCTTSGFGPDERSAAEADVTCVVADVRSTTFTTLASHHPGCIASAGWGVDCNAAIHRYCGSQGFPSGWGPVEQSSGNATVACVRAADVVTTSYTDLRTHHAGCDGSTQRMGSECNAAIHRFCRARGAVSGFGPVENSGDTAYVACVRN